MHFIVKIQREKESRMTSRSRSENISIGRQALTSKPRLTPRLGLCQSMSPRLIFSNLELEVILDSYIPALVFWWDFPVQGTRSFYKDVLCMNFMYYV